MFDDETGLWKFGTSAPSKQTVDSDMFSKELSIHVGARNLYPDEPEFFPDVSNLCSCGVSANYMRLKFGNSK